MKRHKQIQRQPRTPAPNMPKTTVFSYHGQRNDSVNKKRTKGIKILTGSHRFMSLWHWSIAFFALVTLGVIIRLDSTPKLILGQNTSSSVIRSPGTYQKSAEIILKNSFRNRTKLTFDTAGFLKRMKSEFPEIENMEVRIPILGRMPVIIVKNLKQPAMILNNGTDSYILDDSGRALLPTRDAPSSVTDKLIKISDQSGLQLQAGSQVMPLGTVRFITGVRAQLNAKQLVISSIDLPAAAQEAHVRIAGQGYYVKFATDGDSRTQVGTYLAVKQKLDKDKSVPKEYIDVRVEEKAFYK